jgi:hypothetical protein
MLHLLMGLAFALVQQDVEGLPARLSDVDDWDIDIFPSKVIWRPYLADPRQPHMGTKIEMPVRHRDHVKIENTLGSSQPIALWTNPNDPRENSEWFIEAACFSRFDIHDAWNMDAADYKFGFPFVYRLDDLALKFNVFHLTSHLGDQFLTKGKDFGRSRAVYHNEEMDFGGGWMPDDEWRFYLEGGYSMYTGPDTKSGRVQWGGEWVKAKPWKGWFTPYSAVDFSVRREQEWDLNTTIDAGIWLRGKSGANGFRLALEYYRGRDSQTQFKNLHEEFVALNISAEF